MPVMILPYLETVFQYSLQFPSGYHMKKSFISFYNLITLYNIVPKEINNMHADGRQNDKDRWDMHLTQMHVLWGRDWRRQWGGWKRAVVIVMREPWLSLWGEAVVVILVHVGLAWQLSPMLENPRGTPIGLATTCIQGGNCRHALHTDVCLVGSTLSEAEWWAEAHHHHRGEGKLWLSS